MTDALKDHEGTVSVRGRTITNLRFADDIDGLAGEEEELAKLVERFDKASAEKTKLMTNNTSCINTEIKVNGQSWSFLSPRGQWRTGKNGGNWLQNYLCCPNDPHG